MTLDTGQELLEEQTIGAINMSASSSEIDMDNDTTTSTHEPPTGKLNAINNIRESNGETREKIQLLLEFPNYINLMICFNNSKFRGIFRES